MQKLKRFWFGGFEVFLALVLFGGRSSLPSWVQELLLGFLAGLWLGSAISRFFIQRFYKAPPPLTEEQVTRLALAEYRASVAQFRREHGIVLTPSQLADDAAERDQVGP